MFKEDAITASHLQAGETLVVVGFGNSMTPILQSGQPVLVAPVTPETELKKNDIVFVKVKGHYYLHKISAVKNKDVYQISNNHGRVNGNVTRSRVYGKVIKRLQKGDNNVTHPGKAD